MRVLVAISILAFLALLWASIAIFRHIRRAQRRRRRTLEASRNNLAPITPSAVIAPPPQPPPVPEIIFNDPEAPAPEVTFTDTQAPFREAALPAFQPYVRQPEARLVEHRQTPAFRAAHTDVEYSVPTEAKKVSGTGDFVDTLPPPPPTQPSTSNPALSPTPYWPHFGFTPSSNSAQPSHAFEAEDYLDESTLRVPTSPSPEPIPYAAPAESSASVTPARLPIVIHPPAPAVKPVYSSPCPSPQKFDAPATPAPLRSAHQPIGRADWAYFNKDMGDLSDPPPAGSRPRIPAFVPQTPVKPKSD